MEIIFFISSKKDSDEIRIMRARSDNIKIMMGSETDEVIEELFEFIRQRYKKKIRRINEGNSFYF